MGKHTVKNYYDEQGRLIIKPYRLKDLALIFDVNQLTLKRWMAGSEEQFDRKGRKYFTVQQVELMVEKFGLPKRLCIGFLPDTNNAV